MNKEIADQEVKEMIEDTLEMPGTGSKETESIASQVGFTNLFDNMPNGCAYYKVLFDQAKAPVNLKYLRVNSVYARNMKRPISEFIGKRVTEIFPHLTAMSFPWIKIYIKVALFGKPVTFTQYFEHQDKWYLISAYSPQRGYIVEILEDITERKGHEAKVAQYVAELAKLNLELQIALIERVASLGTLATGVAHEMNEPLQALKIMADGMIYWYDKGKQRSMEKVIADCRRISVQADYITAIIERMQDFANRAWSDTLEAVDLNKIIKQTVSLVQENVRAHNIQLRENICKVSPIVCGDIKRLKEIVIIILVNAIESFDSVDQVMKEIVLTTSCVKNSAVIEISNNGPAIPDDIIEKIFEPLFASARSGAQLGMGMIIVKSIVDAHNGTIQVFNFHQQVMFRIEFPLKASDAAASALCFK